jgi:hypothetical protein
MNGVAADLRELLAAGWEVTGFQPSVTTVESGTETDGYMILLKRGSDLAMCAVMYDDQGYTPVHIYYLTRERA